MLAKKSLFLGAAAVGCALIASCGGGGDSSPTPTPTPTGTPTPSPTPTPTPTPPAFTDFDFSKAFTATVSGASYIYAYFTPSSGGSEVWSDGALNAGASKIVYAISPESAAFTWPDPATLLTFAAADRQTATATLRTYRKGDDALTMELPFGNVLRVTYERKQSYTRDTVPGTLRSNRVTLFYNQVSTTSAISSNLSYTGTAQVVGGKSGTTAPGVISSPQATFTVTASDKKIAGSIQIVENVNGTATVRAVLPISAVTAANGTFSGNIDDTANGFKGTYVGALAGPSREEVLIIFSVSHTDGREFLGSLIGKRNP
ncbi:MAG: hypothetical protein ACTHK5_07555 [Tsuneonella sp.]